MSISNDMALRGGTFTDLDGRRRLVAAQFALKGESPPVLRAIPEEAKDFHS